MDDSKENSGVTISKGKVVVKVELHRKGIHENGEIHEIRSLNEAKEDDVEPEYEIQNEHQELIQVGSSEQ